MEARAVPQHGRPPAARTTEMAWIAAGRFSMGSNDHYQEEAPAHLVEVDGYFIDRYPVTNRDFAAFVEATGHVTFAELAPDPAGYPGATPEILHAGSLVFTRPHHRVDTRDRSQWWRFVKGADWHHPQGADSPKKSLPAHPVIHVAYADALAYAHWAGKDLPTEAEWEYAARGGLDGAEFAWGGVFTPNGRHLANTWQGEFPAENLLKDGYQRTSPVGAFPPNGYGLYDMIGNVWEWTRDWFTARHPTDADEPSGIPRNPQGGMAEESCDPGAPEIAVPRKVLKGGSHLCAPNHCSRYRPAARRPQPVETPAGDIGFRCVVRA
jgi:formylglycine-generating enzyme required for sulfatase activity